MSSELSQYIIDRLERDLDVLRADFTRPRDIPTRFTAIDDLFPADTAAEISNAFPPVDEMRIYKIRPVAAEAQRQGIGALTWICTTSLRLRRAACRTSYTLRAWHPWPDSHRLGTA